MSGELGARSQERRAGQGKDKQLTSPRVQEVSPTLISPALIVAHSQVKKWSVAREEAQGSMGIFRYRLTLRNDSLLEMFERFHLSEGQVFVTKYSFHW
jgi:hypothetical protein